MEDFEESSPILNEDFEAFFTRDLSEDSNNSVFMIHDDSPPSISETQLPHHNFEEKKELKLQRKDSFDYDKYIKGEMNRLGTENMSESCRRKMIQKIRNRMSAQRSRMRAKGKTEVLEKENQELKNVNFQLLRRITGLESEVCSLKEKIRFLESSNTAVSSSEEEKSVSNNSDQTQKLKREENKRFSGRTGLFVALAILCAIVLPEKGTLNNKTKMGGIVPMIGLSLPQASKQLQTVDDICRSYCTKAKLLCDQPIEEKKALPSWEDQLISYSNAQEKRVALLDRQDYPRFICHDIHRKPSASFFHVIVNKPSIDKLNHGELFLAELHPLQKEVR